MYRSEVASCLKQSFGFQQWPIHKPDEKDAAAAAAHDMFY
jgi:hypothetical protein